MNGPLIFMVNVGKYTIHGFYGSWNCRTNHSHRIHGTGMFTYMNGGTWPHEEWEM